MKTLLKLILFATTYVSSAVGVEFLSLRKELLKIPVDYEMKYSVRVSDPNAIVTENDREMAPNFDVSIIKVGDRCRITSIKTDMEPPLEMLRVCYDGRLFYSFLAQPRTLYVGTNPGRFDPEINGFLKFSPAFVVLVRENLYGKSSEGETQFDKLFVMPGAPGGTSLVKLSDPKNDFRLEGFDFTIPRHVAVSTFYKGIKSPIHSFKTQLDSFDVISSDDYPATLFKIDTSEAIRIIDTDTNIERRN